VVPKALVTPLTPKKDKATALKHRHEGDGEKADELFCEAKREAYSDGQERYS